LGKISLKKEKKKEEEEASKPIKRGGEKQASKPG
jgi:hypothetical protein